MTARRAVSLGTAQETLLIPPYARAGENRKPDAALRDVRAEEIVAAIDHDFTRFDGLPSPVGSVPRTALFDQWRSDLLTRRPGSTVVELGAGLNTRYERIGNGRTGWSELDLPDVIDVRRSFFAETSRRATIAASVTDTSGSGTVASSSTAPYSFAAEAVLPILAEDDPRRGHRYRRAVRRDPARPWTPPSPKSSVSRTDTARSARPRHACSGPAPSRTRSPPDARGPRCSPPETSPGCHHP